MVDMVSNKINKLKYLNYVLFFKNIMDFVGTFAMLIVRNKNGMTFCDYGIYICEISSK